MRKVPVMNGQVVKTGAYTVFNMNDADTTNLITPPFEVGAVQNYKPEGWKVAITPTGTILCDYYQHGKRKEGLQLQLDKSAKAVVYHIKKTYPLPPKPVAPKRFVDYVWLRKLKGKTQERS